MKAGQGMRQPQMGGSRSQLAPTPVLGRKTGGTKTVTIEGVGTAEYTLPEYRSVRRLLRDSRFPDQARNAARLIHELKVAFPGSEFVAEPVDDQPWPDETGEQLTL